MSLTLGRLIAMGLLPSLIGLTAATVTAGELTPPPSATLEVADIKFDAITTGKNVVTVTVRNLTDQTQVLMLDIRTQPAPQPGGGWQTQFPEKLGPDEQKVLSFGYAFSAAPEAEGFVRLRFYDFRPVDDQQFQQFFQEVKHTVSEIGLKAAESATSPASPEVTKAVLAQFARFQRLVQDRKYGDAWQMLTRTHRQAAFFNRPDGQMSFTAYLDMNPSPAPWSRADIIRLQPGEVRMRNGTAILSARLGETAFTLEFAQEQGEWRLDWVNGWPPLPSPRDRDARLAALLPRLEHRATPHFDIYYIAGSSAARDIARIAEQRESGYRAISEFLGATASPRIRLIFFEDAGTKTAWTWHQGNGLAYGTTIVEIHNQSVQLDPFHETTHILAGPLGDPPAIFDEGLAVYMSERLGAPPLKGLGGGDASAYARVRELKAEGKWIPLAELLTYQDIGSAESQPLVSYPQAGAFVKFLVDAYGKEKLLAAYKELHKSGDSAVQQQNVAALERICGKPLPELNREWLAAMGVKEVAAMQTPSRANLKPFTAPAEPLSASYTIDAQLDPGKKQSSGTETIRLTNRSSLTLTTLALTKGSGGGSSFEVTIAGTRPEVVPSPEGAAGDTPVMVALPEPLHPKQTVELQLTFKAPIAVSYYGDWRLTDWHPKLWWGYSTLDDYAVRIEAPAGWNLVASGLLGEDGVWRAKGVRSFGIVTASDFQVMQVQASGTLIRALYRPTGRECVDLVMKTAADVITYYQSEFGFYPQPFLSIVPGMDRPAGGYPVATGVVTVHGQERLGERPTDWWRWITAHEIGHQYWGEHVLADNFFDPSSGGNLTWLMIGLGIHMDHAYSRAQGLDRKIHQDLAARYLEGIAQGLDTTVELPAEQLAKIKFDRNNVVIHGKGYAIISALESVVETDGFRRVVRDCLQRYHGRRFTTNDLQQACEAETGQDLGWFFDQWVRSNRQLAYRVASKESTKNGDRYLTRVGVERTGSLEMPILVEARFEDGSNQRASTDRLAARSELIFESPAPAKEVVLDPEGVLPLREMPVGTADQEISALPWTGAGEKAREVFERAQEVGVQDGDAWLKLGLTLYDGEFYPEAYSAFRKLEGTASDKDLRAVALVWQGHLHDVAGQREEALDCYRKAKDVGMTGTMRHDQYGMVIDADWIEARLKTPFQRAKK